MTDTKIISYPPFLEEILSKIQLARYEMLKTVSKQTVALYWEIGKAAVTLKTYDYFPITELNPAFLNPESRNAQLKKRYLLKLPLSGTFQDSIPTAKPEHLKP